MCLYACLHLCGLVCVMCSVCTGFWVCVLVRMFVCLHCADVSMHLHACLCVLCVYMCVFPCLCLHLCVCLYVFVCVFL